MGTDEQPSRSTSRTIDLQASPTGDGDFGLGRWWWRRRLPRLIGRRLLLRRRRPILHLEHRRRRAPFRRPGPRMLAAAVRVLHHVAAGDREPNGRRRRRHCRDLDDRLLFVGVLVQLVTREEASYHDLASTTPSGCKLTNMHRLVIMDQ